MESFSASLFAAYGGVERNTAGLDFIAENIRYVLFAGQIQFHVQSAVRGGLHHSACALSGTRAAAADDIYRRAASVLVG